MASPPVTKPLGKECSNSLQAHLPHFQERPTDGKPNQQALVASLLKLWPTTSRVLSAPARSNSIVTGSADRSCLERMFISSWRQDAMSCGLAQQGAAVAPPSPHIFIFAHAPRCVVGPADRDTDLSCRAQGRTDHPTARKFDTKRTIRSGGHPRSASRRQIISVGNCPVPDANRVRDVRDGSQQTHAPRQIAPYRSACRCGRARLIRAIPL